MTRNVAVVSPHPDDETLGCAGTLFRHKAAGDAIHWILVTDASGFAEFTSGQREARKNVLGEIARLYGFASVTEFGFPTTRLDTIPVADLVARLSEAFSRVMPHTVYLPYQGDVHTDHAAVFNAGVSALKWFRRPEVCRILAYETLSETEQGIDLRSTGFRPNVFVDITGYLGNKLTALNCYAGENRPFPFPRSEQAVRALAQLRGATAGYEAAEAFMLLRERL